MNTESSSVDAEPSLKLTEDTADSGGSPKPEAFLDNVVNRRSQELLQVIEKIRGECDVMKERKRAREEECEELRSANCEAWARLLESSLSALESKVASLEAEKARLEVVEASLKKELDDVKRDRMEVVSKVVPYAALELVHSDELGRLVGKLVSSTVLYGRCARLIEQAAYQAGTRARCIPSRVIEFCSGPFLPPNRSSELAQTHAPPTLQRHVPHMISSRAFSTSFFHLLLFAS
ncbi:hypothetical protein Tco_1014496 [Tanacetum coccineum]